MSENFDISDADLADALDQIARTPAGLHLYLRLQKRLMTVLNTADSGALLIDQGERRLAATLMGAMTRGIEESGGRTDPITGAKREPCIVIRTGGPVPTGNAFRGAGRRGQVDDGPGGSGPA